MKVVPCNGCVLCCQGDAIRLEEEEKEGDYKTEPHPYVNGAVMLAHKPNGDCIYLENNGCSIHGRAPSACRIADCRSIAARIDFDTARHLHSIGKLDLRVWDRGRALLGMRIPQ